MEDLLDLNNLHDQAAIADLISNGRMRQEAEDELRDAITKVLREEQEQLEQEEQVQGTVQRQFAPPTQVALQQRHDQSAAAWEGQASQADQLPPHMLLPRVPEHTPSHTAATQAAEVAQAAMNLAVANSREARLGVDFITFYDVDTVMRIFEDNEKKEGAQKKEQAKQNKDAEKKDDDEFSSSESNHVDKPSDSSFSSDDEDNQGRAGATAGDQNNDTENSDSSQDPPPEEDNSGTSTNSSKTPPKTPSPSQGSITRSQTSKAKSLRRSSQSSSKSSGSPPAKSSSRPIRSAASHPDPKDEDYDLYAPPSPASRAAERAATLSAREAATIQAEAEAEADAMIAEIEAMDQSNTQDGQDDVYAQDGQHDETEAHHERSTCSSKKRKRRTRSWGELAFKPSPNKKARTESRSPPKSNKTPSPSTSNKTSSKSSEKTPSPAKSSKSSSKNDKRHPPIYISADDSSSNPDIPSINADHHAPGDEEPRHSAFASSTTNAEYDPAGGEEPLQDDVPEVTPSPSSSSSSSCSEQYSSEEAAFARDRVRRSGAPECESFAPRCSEKLSSASSCSGSGVGVVNECATRVIRLRPGEACIVKPTERAGRK